MKRSLTHLALMVTLCLAGTALAVTTTHKLIEIDISGPNGADFIRQNRGKLDVVWAKPGHQVHISADAQTLHFLATAGQPYVVLDSNLEASHTYTDKGTGFGIYHTWSENIAFVDSLRLRFPNVISAKWSIGQSLQGRDLWCFRVSDNPDLDENEPEILIDGLHHAREVMAAEFPIMFAEYLASNYGTDPEITWLLNHRELYIVPVVNPDGFVYNEQTNPAGGGMWRKNRRVNPGGSYGVDLNRNYDFMWGLDNSGSSPTPTSEVYRGTAPASEPEVQAMNAFTNSHTFRTNDSIHTYSNLTLYPWGYTNAPSPDGATYDYMAAQMTSRNGYTPGQPGNILYNVNGAANDWMYSSTTGHNSIYSFTNEIGSGSDGFWPAASRRQALFEDNIWPHIYLMRVAGNWVTAHTPVTLNPVKSVAPGQSADFSFSLTNDSVFGSSLGLNISIKSDDPWIQLGAANRTIGALASLATTTIAANPIPVTVDPNCPNGHTATVNVAVHLAEGDLSYPLSFTVGTPVTVVNDSLEAGTTNWSTTGTWNTTAAAAHSPARSLTDSPVGNYSNLSSTAATLTVPVSANRLQFWHKYAIENNYDYGLVQVSTGGTWTTIASYTGFQTAWQFVDLDLSPWIGQTLQVRFDLETDYSVTEDGWYIDDVVMLGSPITSGLIPPVAAAPIGGALLPASGQLTITNALVMAPTYGFRVYSDPDCTVPVAEVSGVVAGAGQTAWTLPVLPAGTYTWRAWAEQAGARSDLSAPESFVINSVSGVGDVVLGQPGLRILDGVTGSQTRLQLTLAGRQDVQVDIYNARGARIRRLHTGSMAGGIQTLIWDGNDSHGRATASGVYLVRMTTDQAAYTGRVVIIR